MQLEGKPEKVKHAILEDNTRALSNMARAGASHRIQLTDLRAARHAEDVAEVAVEKTNLEPVDLEGNVLPPDEVIPLDKHH